MQSAKRWWFATAVLIIGAGGFFAITYTDYRSYVREFYKDKNLYNRGIKINATITDIEPDHSIEINHHNPFIVYLTWTDPATQQVYTFQASGIWDRDNILESVQTLPVYVNSQDYSEYYINLSAVGLRDALNPDAE